MPHEKTAVMSPWPGITAILCGLVAIFAHGAVWFRLGDSVTRNPDTALYAAMVLTIGGGLVTVARDVPRLVLGATVALAGGAAVIAAAIGAGILVSDASTFRQANEAGAGVMIAGFAAAGGMLAALVPLARLLEPTDEQRPASEAEPRHVDEGA